MRYSKRRKRNYIIVGLCAVVLLMTIGYAYFSNVLNISSTAEITSNWDVEITKIETIDKVGDADNKEMPTFTRNSADINATFLSPGDSIKYQITVSNLGTIDAVIDSVKLEMDSQNVIIHEIEGITARENLEAGDSKTFTLTMTFNKDITSEPNLKNILATLRLNYLQSGDSSNFSSADSSTSDGISINSLNLTSTETSVTAKVNTEEDAYRYYYSIDNNMWYENPSSEYTIYDLKPYTDYTVYVKAENSDGEVVVYQDTIKTKDNTNPTLKIEKGENVIGENDWYKGLELNITATDNDRINTIKYCVSSTSCTPNTNLTLTDGSATQVMSNGANPQILCVTATDRKGNITNRCTDNYKVDGAVPTLSNMTATSNDDTISINLTAADTHSGVSTYYYSKDGGVTYVSSTASNYTFTALDDGDYLVTSYVKDEAGNVSETQAKSVTVRATTICGTKITNLSDCVIATEAGNDDIEAAKLSIKSKGIPSFTVTSPAQTYGEVQDTTTSNVTTTGNIQIGTGYNLISSTGYYSLTGNSSKDPGTVDLNSGSTYYTCGSASASCTTMYKITNIVKQSDGVYSLTKYNYTSQITGYDNSSSGMYATTDYDGNDTYYFRGSASGNYVKFANKYWRIIRVNGDGTLRIIYDGTSAHDNGEASTDRQVGTSAFNSYWSDNAYVGYMYGNYNDNQITEATYTFDYTGLNSSYEYWFGTEYTFDASTNTFKIAGTPYQETLAEYKTNHNTSELYTCFDRNQNNGCQRLLKVKEWVSATSMRVYPVEYSSTSLSDAHSNITPSTMKNYLEGSGNNAGWYANNLTAYTSKLSTSTIFCNNRTKSSHNGGTYTNSGFGITPTIYGYERFWAWDGTAKGPTLDCTQAGDRFSVDSGLLSKPVGLITADEVALAGGKTGSKNNLYYLYTGTNYWTMSPSHFHYWAYAGELSVLSTGELSNGSVSGGYGVRPVVNLNSSNLSFTGTGTKTDPYVVS